MIFFVSREGVWDLDPAYNAPTLKVTGLQAGTLIKVTVNFNAQVPDSDATDGFYYSISTPTEDDVMPVTPATRVCQSSDGWQSCTLVALFEALPHTDGEAEFGCQFNKGDLSGRGTLMNFVMIAEVL